MTYAVRGLDPAPFAPLFAMDGPALARRRAIRMRADSSTGYPCRVSLRDAGQGEELLLLHHVSHDVETPYRTAFAIYVRRSAEQAVFIDACPPVFAGRPIALRGYDGAGMMQTAILALPGRTDTTIRKLLDDPAIAYIDAHNAAYGCFSARIERHD